MALSVEQYVSRKKRLIAIRDLRTRCMCRVGTIWLFGARTTRCDGRTLYANQPDTQRFFHLATLPRSASQLIHFIH